FFFRDPASTHLYPLSLHERSSDLVHGIGGSSCVQMTSRFVSSLLLAEQSTSRSLPISGRSLGFGLATVASPTRLRADRSHSSAPDRKSTRLNSSHVAISYAVFCLK